MFVEFGAKRLVVVETGDSLSKRVVRNTPQSSQRRRINCFDRVSYRRLKMYLEIFHDPTYDYAGDRYVRS